MVGDVCVYREATLASLGFDGWQWGQGCLPGLGPREQSPPTRKPTADLFSGSLSQGSRDSNVVGMVVPVQWELCCHQGLIGGIQHELCLPQLERREQSPPSWTQTLISPGVVWAKALLGTDVVRDGCACEETPPESLGSALI